MIRPATPVLDDPAPGEEQAAAPLLLHVFPSFAVGGAQVRFAALANRFGPRWRHVVVAMDGRSDCARRVGDGVRLSTVGPPWEAAPGPVQRLARMAALLRRLNPALLITSNWGSIEWAVANRLAARVPHLHMEDGFGPEESGVQFGRRIMARRVALRQSNVVLPSSTLLRVARDVWKLPPDRLSHIPNGIDLRSFRPDGPKAELGLGGDGPLIGAVGALRPEKNFARLLRAAAVLLREGAVFRLALVGDGPERQRLEALAAELGIFGMTHFTGHVADPAAAYRAMDVACLSSDTEQMPFSVLEAMATGLPVATTEVGDVRLMLSEPNAPYLAARTDAALAGALRPLLHDAGLRHRIGRANRAKAERDYDQEAMFQAHAALIERTVLSR
ncbi:glycosyltransferase [Roseomonas populi]|uniref:Glycosyltransferase n=1 Tax=Roseomonas populi TaxID=3121582 RepID=A0ABT1XAK0_9PROT|nr:glycosyltransferase [Roseomonas pecuniae]MCR0985124.1 glycosyltransferase [Roseomonas pecuniae]